MRQVIKESWRALVRPICDALGIPVSEIGWWLLLCAVAIAILFCVYAYITREHADAFSVKGGWTPLMSAAKDRLDPEKSTKLLKAGANVNAMTGGGCTPLMIAAKYNPNPEVLSVLLEVGADTTARDNDGKTALDYAIGNENLQGTQTLKELEEATNQALKELEQATTP